MKRARSKIRPEIEREQCGFVQDSRTRNAIFMRNSYVSFSKAFDGIRHSAT